MKITSSEILNAALLDIDRFSGRCEAEEYTDSGEAWELLGAIKTRIRTALETDPPPDPDSFEADRALLPFVTVNVDSGPLTAMQRLRWIEKLEAFLRNTHFHCNPLYRNVDSLVTAVLRHHKRICLAAYGSADT